MEEKKLSKVIHRVNQVLKAVTVVLVLLLSLVIYLASDLLFGDASEVDNEVISEIDSSIVEGIHVQTGLIEGPGLELVIQNCTSCHSSKLITQNKMSLEGWSSTIQWMQETQNLWDLGENEKTILDYLASNYAPQKAGRRKKLENIEWYRLEVE